MLKILVIDDDRRVCSFLQRLLVKKFGMIVLVAYDGIEGLAIINREKPDLVFCDVNMPLMDGVEVLDSIRSNPRTANTHVVILSSVSDRSILSKMLKLGVNDYILKPLFYEEVQQRIIKIIKSSMASARLKKEPVSGDLLLNTKKRILIVDKDVNFRDFFIKMYSSKFEILEAVDGLDGFKTYMAEYPQIVLLSSELAIINENILAKKIFTISHHLRPEIYLMYESEKEIENVENYFHGVLKKSFIPEKFNERFSEIVLHKKNYYFLFTNKIQNQFFSALQQTVAIYQSQEIAYKETPSNIVKDDFLYTKLLLKDDVRHLDIAFELAVSINSLQSIVHINSSKSENLQTINDIFIDFARTVISRLRLAFEQEGIIVVHPSPVPLEIPDSFIKEKHDIFITATNEIGQLFLAGLKIV